MGFLHRLRERWVDPGALALGGHGFPEGGLSYAGLEVRVGRAASWLLAQGLGPGDVLVAPITDPSWTPLFLAAEAVVVDVGATMSHAVIVSRELGIPCVVSAVGATRSIPDGATIEVDGNSGTVTVIELP